ncbi:MarR family transcriptional regulator [Lactobacillus gigeriorum DSM 23908 = CRBIP 24.85]|uniref:MarR family transcriptional regulator n=1 Tax=Lactobacillus gigeriorum DSM 23908 = CRBIP 24.85 TaxID=1423751 RepID=A0ABR5PV02_9LACO|nr:MarR family transcriptional regulator [Lactobacillus gigeriorum DSM 23908 = CRBIP 24.85]
MIILHTIKSARIYGSENISGYRILVDRVWPRGISKVKAKLDLWKKSIAPSTELRKWFNHEDEKYPEFKEKYLDELTHNSELPDFISLVREELAKNDVVLLYGAKNTEHNQAVVLQEYLDKEINSGK